MIMRSEIPKSAECGNTGCQKAKSVLARPYENQWQLTSETPLHHLVVARHVGGDEDDLGAEAVPRVREQLDRVGAAAALLGVPEDHPLGLDVVVDESGDRRPECLLLVGADPDEEPKRGSGAAAERPRTVKGYVPIRALDAGRKRRADARACAHADAPLVHRRRMPDASWRV